MKRFALLAALFALACGPAFGQAVDSRNAVITGPQQNGTPTGGSPGVGGINAGSVAVNSQPTMTQAQGEFTASAAISATGGTYSATLIECQHNGMDVTGALTSNLTIECPSPFTGTIPVINGTTGAYTVQLSVAFGATSAIVPQGGSETLHYDGAAWTELGSGGVSVPCTSPTRYASGAISPAVSCAILTANASFTLANGADPHPIQINALSAGASVTLTLNGSSVPYPLGPYGVMNVWWDSTDSTYLLAN